MIYYEKLWNCWKTNLQNSTANYETLIYYGKKYGTIEKTMFTK